MSYNIGIIKVNEEKLQNSFIFNNILDAIDYESKLFDLLVREGMCISYITMLSTTETPLPVQPSQQILFLVNDYIKKIGIDKELLSPQPITHDNCYKTLDVAASIIRTQYEWMKEVDDDNCDVYFIYATLNDLMYGGIFLFHNKQDQSYGTIQEITKYITPLLVSLIYPNIEFKKLNSLLIPAIENLAKDLGIDKIYVQPFPLQAKILSTYYGFKRTYDSVPACGNTHDLGPIEYANDRYVKKIN